MTETHHPAIEAHVKWSLQEDVGGGDITAALLPEQTTSKAVIITREPAIFCGKLWAEATFRQCDPDVKCEWMVAEGARVEPNQTLCKIKGNTRALLTAERTALNYLQTLSGTATVTAMYANRLAGTPTKLLDTRKTLPGLRYAQKYAVKCGGGINHRMGLFDAYLIKENHILACGSIEKAIMQARKMHPEKTVEVEVESLEEFDQALHALPDIILLDNFDMETLGKAVTLNKGRVRLEASGNVTLNNIREIAEIGVDYISIGALTKHLRAIDLSLRFT